MTNQEPGEEHEGRQHPPQYRADLNPDAYELERIQGTASQLKPLTRNFNEMPDEVLERILIVSEGSRLKQGSTYLDLNDPGSGEFVATGDMTAGPGSKLVPKSRTDYEAWNLLEQRLGLEA